MQKSNSDSTRDIFNELHDLWKNGREAEAFELFSSIMRSYETDKAHLKIQLEQMQRRLFGRRSEKISSAQLQLFLKMLEAAQTDEKPEEPPSSVLNEEEEALVKEHRRRRPDKKPLDLSKVPKKVTEVQPTPEELLCPCCQTPRASIGYEESSTLERVPASFSLNVTRRPKLVCGKCKEGVDVPGTAPIKPIEGSVASASLLADIASSKYAYHTPLSRLRTVYKNEGLDIPLNVLVSWVSKTATMLEPLAKRILEKALQCHILQTDDTRITVLDADAPGGSKRGHLWVYLGDKTWVAFDYTPDWSAKRPREILQARQGWLQADAYAGYDALFTKDGATAVEAGCWSHGRREFKEALDDDKRAAEPLRLIKQIFQLEELARAKNMDAAARLQLRKTRSQPIVKRLGHWLDKMRDRVPPKDQLGKAITYATNQWQALNRFLEDGQLEVDNNAAERALRAIAVGRKNWMFAGSDAGARTAAILYTVLGTARLAGIDPKAYLTDVIQRLADGWHAKKLDALLPHNWTADKAQKQAA